MAGGTRIIAFESASAEASGDEFLLTEDAVVAPEDAPQWDDAADEEPMARTPRAWILPAVAAAAVLGWSGFFAWAVADRVAAGLVPAQWVELVRDWAVPVLLVALLALFAQRNSRREALRFGNAANLLSTESARLETRLSVVNRELSLAREFIGAQSRDLETLGRLAADRLSTEADRMQGLIRDNHARVEAIGTVSSAALDNMEKLRGQLPVIASSAKDVTNNIGTAGRMAHMQLQEMINGFNKLNEFGQASERQVHVLRGLVDETIAEFVRQTDQFGEIAGARFSAMRDTGAELRTQLDSQEIEALAAIRSRARALGEELEDTRRQLETNEAEGLTSMRARLSALRDEGAAIARALREGEARALETWQSAAARTREELQTALAALNEAEAEAATASRDRIAGIGEELARLERQGLDHAARFAAEADRRQAETAAAHEAALVRMREHMAAFDDMAGARRQQFAEADQAAVTEMHQRFAALDSVIATRRAEHEAQGARIAAEAGAIADRLGEFERRLGEIVAHSTAAGTSVAANLDMLTEHLQQSRTTLAGADGEIAALTDSSVRLLELIQASVRHSSDELPRALARGDAQLADIEGRMAALREAADDADTRGTRLAATIDAAGEALRRTYAEMTGLQGGLEQAGSVHGATLAGLREELDAIARRSADLAEHNRAQLSAALEELSGSTRAALAGFGESGASAVSALARQLGSESAAALDRAMRASTAETAGQLEAAVTRAATVGRDAAMQLRDQLGKVNELAANLESRVAHARERAEEQVDNDFTRRVALITESLNSNAIDIAKALSVDVADTAWSAYLRGDRGIFTRRAVSLVDNAEAKAIVQIYERDREFHEHVSRYIHDFEAMLRQVLSARDGQALGVTLLSSDMGKLYVALAQAIQRLRS